VSAITVGPITSSEKDYYLHPQNSDYEEPSIIIRIPNRYINGNQVQSISASVSRDDYEYPVSTHQDNDDYIQPI